MGERKKWLGCFEVDEKVVVGVVYVDGEKFGELVCDEGVEDCFVFVRW